MLDRPEAEGRALLRRLDGYAGIRDAIGQVAKRRRQWAGIPLPISNQHLVIEPTFPQATDLMAFNREPEADPLPPDVRERNAWWSDRLRATIVIWEENGRIVHGLIPGSTNLYESLQTLGCADAWGLEQEKAALALLGTLIRHRQFKQYLLTGMFIETSRRSGLTYLFRRLRPTIVLDTREPARRYAIGATEARAVDRATTLGALCLHPIGYYANSWAGAMTPTDDVIAHLMLMRGDEPMFWRRSNQHSVERPQAGV